jgi:glycerophosphoryl diester phosphodiesterase
MLNLMIMFLLRSVLVVVVTCVAQTTVFSQLIIGHRGASYDAPENTLASFKLALEQGADGFEADFYLTTDGNTICFHDKDTKRLCGEKLIVAKTPFEVLRGLDVGSWKGPQWRDQRMPTMAEVLAAVPVGKKIFIELKSGPEIVEPMASAIEASSLLPEQIVIISFNDKSIAESKRQLPHLRAHWLAGYKEQPDGSLAPTKESVAATIRKIGADGFGSNALPEHFNAAFIDYLRENGCREFHVWTVNDPKVARFYQQLGAWSITTDRPGWLRDHLDRSDSP